MSLVAICASVILISRRYRIVKVSKGYQLFVGIQQAGAFVLSRCVTMK